MESSSVLVITNYSTKGVNQRNENMISCSIFGRAAAIRSGFLPAQDKSPGAAILLMLPQPHNRCQRSSLNPGVSRVCPRISETTPMSIHTTGKRHSRHQQMTQTLTHRRAASSCRPLPSHEGMASSPQDRHPLPCSWERKKIHLGQNRNEEKANPGAACKSSTQTNSSI